MKRTFPKVFQARACCRSTTTPAASWTPCSSSRRCGKKPPRRGADPGRLQLRHFEQSFLARQMGVELRRGPRPARRRRAASSCAPPAAWNASDVIYRRIDDDYLDPRVFRPTRCWRAGADEGLHGRQGDAGQRAGTGVADDKVVYAYVPKMIKYYLGEERSCRTCPRICWEKKGPRLRARPPRRTRGEVRERVGRLRHADRPALHEGTAGGVRDEDQGAPRNYIAQPTLGCRGCRRWSTAAWRGGTSTCVRTSSTARNLRASRWADPRGAQEGLVVVNSSQAGAARTPGCSRRRRRCRRWRGWTSRSPRRCRCRSAEPCADATYWVGRYIERAESVARSSTSNLNLALDLPPGTQEQWKPLVGTTGDLYRCFWLYGGVLTRNARRARELAVRL